MPAKKAAQRKTLKRASAAPKKTARRRTGPTTERMQADNTARKRRIQNKRTAANENTIRNFRMIVNIDADQLERWLDTPQSKKLETMNAATDVGHQVQKLLCKRRDKYDADDLKQMQTVIDHVNSRLSKRPKGDIVASNWRFSLMNWGHDPSKPLKRVRGAKSNV